MGYVDLLLAVAGYHKARYGLRPSMEELLQAAAVALAERVLSDHPEGAAHRIGHPRADDMEAARARLQAAVRAYRDAWSPKVIRLS